MTWNSMDDAPTDGSVIEVMSNGDILPVFWTEEAHDGSPYGTEGWEHADDRLIVMDADGWRYPEVYRFIDMDGENEERYQAYLENLAAEKATRNAVINRRRQETRKRNRASAERRYLAAFGVEADKKMGLREIYRAVEPIEFEKRMKEDGALLASIFASFR